MLKKILDTVSVSGDEEELQRLLVSEMESSCDVVYEDKIGNVVFTHKGNSEEIMLVAHSDEVGLMVTGFTETGFLKVMNVGGTRARLYQGNAVQVRSAKGSVQGIVLVDIDTLKQDDFQVYDLKIDIGARTKVEAESKVELGDRVVVDTRINSLLNNRIGARALDNKLGIYVVMKAFEKARELKCQNTIHAVSTVGEEIGKHGAKWIAQKLKATKAIIIDVTNTSDCDGFTAAKDGEVELGKGPVLCLNPICSKRMNVRIREIAKKLKISLQYEVTSGRTYTDADEILMASGGVEIAILYVPLRYMHSPYEVADLKDVEEMIELLTEYLVK